MVRSAHHQEEGRWFETPGSKLDRIRNAGKEWSYKAYRGKQVKTTKI